MQTLMRGIGMQQYRFNVAGGADEWLEEVGVWRTYSRSRCGGLRQPPTAQASFTPQLRDAGKPINCCLRLRRRGIRRFEHDQ